MYIIAAEGLSWLFRRAKECGLVKGAEINKGELSLTHLQFADDTLVFCEANREELVNVKRLLRCFEIVSGLRINFKKISLSGVGVKEVELKDFAAIINCRVQSLPIKYLGLPLDANPRLVSTWRPVIDKCKARLASWKKKYLSFGGRLTLVKSVLTSLPVYYISLFKMPQGVENIINRLQNNFLWGESEGGKKLHLVGWEKVNMSLK